MGVNEYSNLCPSRLHEKRSFIKRSRTQILFVWCISSAIIIYGISIAYGITGSTNIGEVIQGFSTLDPTMPPLALLAVGMFIAGFGFKMGLVPFHMWLPDAYEGAPPTITAF